MKLKLVLSILALVLVAAGIILINTRPGAPQAQALDPANATYDVNGQPVTLVNGRAAAEAAPGSAGRVVTMLFGEPVIGDLNNDGQADAAVMLAQETGGSGVFYYVAAVISGPAGARGTNAFFLGDRIAPQNIEIRDGDIIANFAERAPGEPMSARPSIGVSRYIVWDETSLSEGVRIAGAGERCGGNMTTAAVCGAGYHCAPAPGSRLPFGDVGGTCAAD